MIFKGREYLLRCNEVRRYIRKNRHSLRMLADGRCPDDNRLLAAVYHLRDGFWLWQIGERRTRQQVLLDVLEYAATELETLIENGEDQLNYVHFWRILRADWISYSTIRFRKK